MTQVNTTATPVKTILIDDEPLARMIVREYLQSYPDIEIVQECGDGFEGIKAIQQLHPDLIFLDIQMPKINGFEMLELVEQPPAVIFTTAFDEYAIRAFETHAVDYLLKPFSKERFDKALRKWLDQRAARANAATTTPTQSSPQSNPSQNTSSQSPAAIQSPTTSAIQSSNPTTPGTTSSTTSSTQSPTPPGTSSPTSDDHIPPTDPTAALLETASQSPTQQQRIVVKTGGKIKIIPLEDIHYLEAADDYVKIHTHNGAFLKNRTMSYFEKALDPTQFVRTHRSYILNISQVTRIDPYEKDSHLCILQSGAQVPVSKAGYVKLKSVLGL